MKKLEIIIACHKYDIFFTKLCVASIRYYYPTIPIHLIKDELNGSFDTDEIERYFNVTIMDLGVEKIGYATAKMFFLISKKFSSDIHYLFLDSDIIFIGKALDKILQAPDSIDVIVNGEYVRNPGSEFNRNYYNYPWAKKTFPDLKFPGYKFNGGQMVLRPGILHKRDIASFFNPDVFPYWNQEIMKYLPGSEQSALNILFPRLARKGKIKLAALLFMWWHERRNVKYSLTLNDVIMGKYPYMVHWVGPKNRYLEQMNRVDILQYFRHQYYSHIPFGKMRLFIQLAKHDSWKAIQKIRGAMQRFFVEE